VAARGTYTGRKVLTAGRSGLLHLSRFQRATAGNTLLIETAWHECLAVVTTDVEVGIDPLDLGIH
jgi:hypothetical protein